jgi:DNA-binding response OmpR family regulator
MRQVLVAEDDAASRVRLAGMLTATGYQPMAVADGAAAAEALAKTGGPKLAILDWEMPGQTGPEVCRRVRAAETDQPPYLLLLTARTRTQDVVTGLDSGANDFLTKPFNRDELLARLKVAGRVLDLQESLAERVRALEGALAEVRELRGLLPICGWCRKRVRTEGDAWQMIEDYLSQHTDVRWSHGICAECMAEVTRGGKPDG